MVASLGVASGRKRGRKGRANAMTESSWKAERATENSGEGLKCAIADGVSGVDVQLQRSKSNRPSALGPSEATRRGILTSCAHPTPSPPHAQSTASALHYTRS